MLLAFDAPTREECTARRAVSNTPLAALALMNDPVFVEASRAFAQRMLLDATPSDDGERIVLAMRVATGRQPTPAEVAVLSGLLDDSRRHYESNPENTEALLQVGDAPRDPTIEPADHAAWMQVTRAILNLHETITVD
jgi:hypothetical protein